MIIIAYGITLCCHSQRSEIVESRYELISFAREIDGNGEDAYLFTIRNEKGRKEKINVSPLKASIKHLNKKESESSVVLYRTKTVHMYHLPKIFLVGQEADEIDTHPERCEFELSDDMYPAQLSKASL